MKLGINWNEASTQRGAVWVIAALVMLGSLMMGKPDYISYVITGASAVAGGLGVVIKDS